MKRRFVLLALPLALGAGAATAQQTDEQNQQAIARAQALLRQLGQEKATLDAELVKLRSENAQLKKGAKLSESALEARAADLESAAREASQLKANLSHREQRLERVTGQLREVVAKYKEKAADLRRTEAERADLQSQLTATQRQLEDAEKKNLALYRINRDILAEFEREGPWDGLLRKEPFSGLKRVDIENLVQEYEHEMGDELRESSLRQLMTPAAK